MSVADILLKYEKWLPDKPHLGMVRHVLSNGWAHIVEDQDGTPFLVNSHGGRIALASVRWDPDIGGSQMRSADASGHQFGTVCDSIDALLSGVTAEQGSVLLDDVDDMIQRMRNREEEMRQAIEEAQRHLAGCPANSLNMRELETMLGQLRETQASGDHGNDWRRLSQDVKEAAGRLEARLSEYRAIALELGALYERVKGARHWDLETLREA